MTDAVTVKRRKPAAGGRVIAAGLSTSAMLGLVAGYAFTAPPAQNAAPPSEPVATAAGTEPTVIRVVVRRHHAAPVSPAPRTSRVLSAPGAPRRQRNPVAAYRPPQPRVIVIHRQAPPVARTSGSH